MNILIVAAAVLFPSCCTHDFPSTSLRFYQHRSCKATGASTTTLPDTVMTFQFWPTEHAIHTDQAATSTIPWALVPMRTPNVYECAFSVEFTLSSSYFTNSGDSAYGSSWDHEDASLARSDSMFVDETSRGWVKSSIHLFLPHLSTVRGMQQALPIPRSTTTRLAAIASHGHSGQPTSRKHPETHGTFCLPLVPVIFSL